MTNDNRYHPNLHPVSDSGLDGIIAFLTKEHGANVHNLGIVHVTASGSAFADSPQNAVDLQHNGFHQSPDAPNQWLRYDFKNRRVKLTGYSIAAHTDNWFLRSWAIEGSHDGEDNHWTALDSRTNNTDAHVGHPIATFNVGDSGFYRFIRLRNTGQTAKGSNSLVVLGFELFGFLLG
jgi:hypothetical protein